MTLDRIIDFFCAEKKIIRNDLFGYHKNATVCTTRYMLWMYLHCSQNYSAGQISKLFNRNRPSVFRGIRVLKYHMEIYSEIKEEYKTIVKKIESAMKNTP